MILGGKEVGESLASTSECCALLEAIQQSYDQTKGKVHSITWNPYGTTQINLMCTQ